ncbi:MAG: hypothetical protein ACOC28_05690 [Alkalispirochaetaceae bacterium]
MAMESPGLSALRDVTQPLGMLRMDPDYRIGTSFQVPHASG